MKRILTGTRWTTFTKFPVAFCAVAISNLDYNHMWESESFLGLCASLRDSLNDKRSMNRSRFCSRTIGSDPSCQLFIRSYLHSAVAASCSEDPRPGPTMSVWKNWSVDRPCWCRSHGWRSVRIESYREEERRLNSGSYFSVGAKIAERSAESALPPRVLGS